MSWGVRMKSAARNFRSPSAVLLCLLLVAGLMIDGTTPACAQDRRPPRPQGFGSSNSSNDGFDGRDVGIGLGIGLGIGALGLILHQATNPPEQPGGGPPLTPLNPPPGNPSGNPEPHHVSRVLHHHNIATKPPSGQFVPDEVIVEFSASTSPEAIDRFEHHYKLAPRESEDFPLIGTKLYRLHILGRRSVPGMVDALQNVNVVARVQPNYFFILQQDAAPSEPQGDSSQYVLDKLQIKEAHRLATGKGIRVAVIDSDIDGTHPDLNGAIAKSFDALGGTIKPHKHGTAMAGAIAARGKLLGIAPGAELLAERAFGETSGAAKGTSFSLYKSLQWAADNDARIVNMSFAGPQDPFLHRLLTAAFGKDMVLVAASGNAGPSSAPLYPAADPDVIAVTATDGDDKLLPEANRGAYVAVAAPGVDILALAPDQAYDLTTGTSVAAAHVSGIAALLLERKPSLKPSDVRAILAASAKPLGPHAEFGAGLVNAYRAVMQVSSKSAGDPKEQAGK